ncbi:jg17031 [Pararge aegeria aegeria]|uniref:Jg17031 protein n=1 Tax=Pararge aegeria aegeria TaxID=348720 RepID=A0A8S4R6D0_9NEOP|nr:jg17031 [Pararge aegeria aegeria]
MSNPTGSSFQWDKLSPAEFQQLQELTSYSSRKLEDVLKELAEVKKQNPDGRHDNDSIERLVVQERIEGTRSRGRSPMIWADQIKAAVAVPLHECARKAAAREEWRRIVKRATTLK